MPFSQTFNLEVDCIDPHVDHTRLLVDCDDGSVHDIARSSCIMKVRYIPSKSIYLTGNEGKEIFLAAMASTTNE